MQYSWLSSAQAEISLWDTKRNPIRRKKHFNMEAESVPLIHLAPFFIMLSCYCEELYLTQSVIFFKRKHKQKLSQTAGSWVTAVIYVTGTHSWFLHCTQHAISPLIVLK